MSTSSPWYKRWGFWLICLAILGYLLGDSETPESSEIIDGAEKVVEKTDEDQVLINDMQQFLMKGNWECVEIAKGRAPEMIGASFTFLGGNVVVENFGSRHELPYNIEFVLDNYPSEGINSAHVIINGNKEMVANFNTDKDLLMLSWANDTVKMKLIRKY
jgi:hypothetical protein